MSIKWTNREVDLLQIMIKKNFTIGDMCKVLKSRSKDSIRHKAESMGLEVKMVEIEIDMELFNKMIRKA